VLPSWYSRMTPWSFSSAWSTSMDSAMRLFCQLATSDGAGRCPIWVVYSARSFSAMRCIRASARNCSVVPAYSFIRASAGEASRRMTGVGPSSPSLGGLPARLAILVQRLIQARPARAASLALPEGSASLVGPPLLRVAAVLLRSDGNAG